MSEIVPDSIQDASHDTSSSQLQNKILLKAVTIELAKPQRIRSTLSVTFDDKKEEKKSERREYMNICWEPGQAWDVTDGGIVAASWKTRSPLERPCKIKIDIDKVLDSLLKGNPGAVSGSDGTREHDHVYEDRRCKITMKFDILGDPQPKSLSAVVKSVKEEAEKNRRTRTRLGFCVRYLKGILPFGELVKEIHPTIKATIALLSATIEILNAQETFNQAIVDLFDSMCDVVDYVADVNQFATVAQLKKVMEEGNTLMRKAVDFFKEHKQRGILGRAFAAFSPRTKEELEGLQMDLSRFKDKFDRGISLHTMATTDELKSRLKELETQIKELVRTNDDDKVLEVLDTKHQTRALRCLNGTRLDLISFIFEWVQTTSNILWIYGYPGAGKSTLAMHIANLFRIAHRLGVIVEFNRNTGVTAVTLWKSISYALAREYRECRNVIVNKIKSGSLDLANATSRDILNQLVIEPLQQLTSSDTKISKDRLPVIIIDALDEAGGLDESSRKARKEVLDCLADWSKLAPGVKLIITSRAEQDIRLAFSKVSHESLELPTGPSVTSQSTRDIQLYLSNGFKDIAFENDIAMDWPSDEIIADLACRAQGVFIWATTILDFVDNVDPCYQLKTILDGQFPAGNVYGLYRQIISTSFPSTYNSEGFVLIVGAIVVLQQPFTRAELAQLLGVDLGTVNGVCKGLRTVLDEGDVVRFKHQSFVDFLTQPTISLSEEATACPTRFHVSVPDAHDRLCRSLFQVMHKGLHFNICNIPSSFMRNDELPRSHFDSAIGRPLAYACRFWSFHLSNTQSEPDLDLISTFIHEDLLSWFESLSGLESLGNAFPSLVSLMERISSIPERATDLQLLVNDAIKFIRYFAQAIAQSAAHLYTTALTFAPKSSLVAQLYAPRFKNIIRMDLGQLDEWPSETVIRGHSSDVLSVAFSPDGKRVVSSSHDSTVRVSDAETGQIVAGPFFQRIGFPIFSHSRKFIALVQPMDIGNVPPASEDSIFVRDVETGRVVSYAIARYPLKITCITFSPDDTHIASGFYDGSVRVYDTQAGRLVMEPLIQGLLYVGSISYSHDGAYIALGVEDYTVQLWDVRGSPHQVQVYRNEGPVGLSGRVAFSSDDRWIASASLDWTFRVWSVKTGQLVAGPFQGHTYFIHSISFSPDSKRIASASGDGTVRIWDVEANVPSGAHLGSDPDFFLCFALSKDSTRIASTSRDGSIQIWDTRTGQLKGGPFRVHEGEVGSDLVAYSPDNKRIVSGSSDGRICIWDVAARETVMELHNDFHSKAVYSVVYSNNGRYIASTLNSQDGRVDQIWDAETGERIQTLRMGGSGGDSLVAFSADDRLVMSDSKRGDGYHFSFWDVETGDLVIESESPTNGVLDFATLSHDGKLVATVSSGGIQLWDATTGKLLVHSFSRHTSWVSCIAFSSNNKLFVSGSYKNTIYVWDVKTGHTIMGPFHGHTAAIRSISFIHDDKCIISGSSDETIRIWSLEQSERSLFTDQSEIDEDGWVKGANGELLFWVPPRHCANLHRPSNTWIIAPHSTQLNFKNARWGADWTECYTP